MSKPFEKRDFQSSELDSLVKIFLLTPDDPLDTFAGIYTTDRPLLMITV